MERSSLSFWDSLLWAIAKENNCSLTISEDFQDNSILGGVKIRNPFYSEAPLESYFVTAQPYPKKQ
jgi:predicted nucleic acid-binding protein